MGEGSQQSKTQEVTLRKLSQGSKGGQPGCWKTLTLVDGDTGI